MGCVQSYFQKVTSTPDNSPSDTDKPFTGVIQHAPRSANESSGGDWHQPAPSDESYSGCVSDDMAPRYGVEATAVRELAANTGTVAILGTTAKCNEQVDASRRSSGRQSEEDFLITKAPLEEMCRSAAKYSERVETHFGREVETRTVRVEKLDEGEGKKNKVKKTKKEPISIVTTAVIENTRYYKEETETEKVSVTKGMDNNVQLVDRKGSQRVSVGSDPIEHIIQVVIEEDYDKKVLESGGSKVDLESPSTVEVEIKKPDLKESIVEITLEEEKEQDVVNEEVEVKKVPRVIGFAKRECFKSAIRDYVKKESAKDEAEARELAVKEAESKELVAEGLEAMKLKTEETEAKELAVEEAEVKANVAARVEMIEKQISVEGQESVKKQVSIEADKGEMSKTAVPREAAAEKRISTTKDEVMREQALKKSLSGEEITNKEALEDALAMESDKTSDSESNEIISVIADPEGRSKSKLQDGSPAVSVESDQISSADEMRNESTDVTSPESFMDHSFGDNVKRLRKVSGTSGKTTGSKDGTPSPGEEMAREISSTSLYTLGDDSEEGSDLETDGKPMKRCDTISSNGEASYERGDVFEDEGAGVDAGILEAARTEVDYICERALERTSQLMRDAKNSEDGTADVWTTGAASECNSDSVNAEKGSDNDNDNLSVLDESESASVNGEPYSKSDLRISPKATSNSSSGDFPSPPDEDLLSFTGQDIPEEEIRAVPVRKGSNPDSPGADFHVQVIQAASKIQAGVRGYLTRKQMREKQMLELEERDRIDTGPFDLKHKGKRMSLDSKMIDIENIKKLPKLRATLSECVEEDAEISEKGAAVATKETETETETKEPEILDKAASTIQTNFRKYIARKSICMGDARFQRPNSAQERPKPDMTAKEEELNELMAVTKIQAGFRGYKARRSIQMSAAAATKIQAGFRGYKVRKVYKKCNSTGDISSATVGDDDASTASNVSVEDTAATKIQAGFRGYLARKRHSIQNTAALKIQTNYRKYKSKK